MATKYVWNKYALETTYNVTTADTTTTGFMQSGSSIAYGNTVDCENVETWSTLLAKLNAGTVSLVYYKIAPITYKYVSHGATSIVGYAVTSYEEVPTQGTFIEQVVGESGEYPTNGEQDGYWYVYVGTREVAGELFATINGVQKQITVLPVMVDGVQREADSLFATVNGVQREVFAKWNPTGLPNGYTRLNYLKSPIGAYINTRYKPNSNTRVVMDCQLISATKYLAPFGAWDKSVDNAFLVATLEDRKTVVPFYDTQSTNITFDCTARHTIELDKNVFKIDGTVLKTFTAATFSTSYEMYLFAYNAAGSPANQTEGYWYPCQIYENGEFVRDYVPCINPDGEYGYYDLIDGVFDGNAGTGTFTGG